MYHRGMKRGSEAAWIGAIKPPRQATKKEAFIMSRDVLKLYRRGLSFSDSLASVCSKNGVINHLKNSLF